MTLHASNRAPGGAILPNLSPKILPKIPPKISPNTSRILRPGSAFAISIALALLAACSTPDKPKPPPVQPVLQSPGHKSITVSGDNAGAAIVLERAQDLFVHLDIPTTSGLEWNVIELNPGVLTVLGSKFERALRNTNVEEAAGATVFHIRAEAPGSVALKFELRRPRSLTAAVQSITYDVTVK